MQAQRHSWTHVCVHSQLHYLSLLNSLVSGSSHSEPMCTLSRMVFTSCICPTHQHALTPPPPPNAYTVHVATLIWSEKEVTGYCPEGRRSHCAITYGSSVLYYGGYNAVYKQHFGDLFLLDTGGRVRESCMRMCLSISLFCSPPPPPYN